MSHAIFFDAGNTLVYLDHPFICALCAERGIDTTSEALLEGEYVAKEEINRRLHSGELSSDEDRWQLYFASILRHVGVPADRIESFRAPLVERHRRLNIWSYLQEGTGELLDELAEEGYRLGVISNSDGRLVDLLEHVGIAHHFELIVDSGVVGVEKPDSRIFEIACEGLGVRASDSLYVGDIYEIDIVGARRAGMPAVLIDPLDRWVDLDVPRITGLAELPEFLRSRM